MTFKIIYDKRECIGAGECEKISPERWKVNNEGKSELKGSSINAQGVFELELPDEEYKKQKEVSEACPSGCIKIARDN